MTLEKYIGTFIKDEDAELGDIQTLLESLQEYCYVDKTGYVKILDKYKSEISNLDSIHLVLCARLLADKLIQKTGAKGYDISASVKTDEIASMLNLTNPIVGARVSDLKRDGYVIALKQGEYTAKPHSVKKLIEKLAKSSPAVR